MDDDPRPPGGSKADALGDHHDLALRLGFRNFDYGPRAKQLKSDDTSHGTKPHLVFLFCDNVGWSNLGYHRTRPTREVVTPQIDGLVRTGLELDRM